MPQVRVVAQVVLSDSVAIQVKALWPGIAVDIRRHLDSTNGDDIDEYLFDEQVSARFPRRGGYYVGMMLATTLARKFPLPRFVAFRAHN